MESRTRFTHGRAAPRRAAPIRWRIVRACFTILFMIAAPLASGRFSKFLALSSREIMREIARAPVDFHEPIVRRKDHLCQLLFLVCSDPSSVRPYVCASTPTIARDFVFVRTSLALPLRRHHLTNARDVHVRLLTPTKVKPLQFVLWAVRSRE